MLPGQWFAGLAAADFDADGRVDIVVGRLPYWRSVEFEVKHFVQATVIGIFKPGSLLSLPYGIDSLCNRRCQR